LQFLNLAGLWLAAIIPVIIIMYLLKPRYQEKLVSSTWLWEQAVRDIEATSPWQRLRRNLLLILQLLVAFLLVLAVIRPSLNLPGTTGRHLIVALDCSPSMKATDVSPSRFKAAKQEILQLIDSMDNNETLTLIAMADQPQVVASAAGDKVKLRQAAKSLKPGSTKAALEPLLSMAAALSERDPQAELIIFSDGKTNIPEHDISLKCPVSWRQIGHSDDNLAITLLSTRRVGKGTTVLARVQNFGDKPRQSEIELWADSKLFDARRLKLAGGESCELSWTEAAGEHNLWQAVLKRPDYFMDDNQAYAVSAAAASRRVLLVSSGNVFLEKSVSLAPNVQMYKTTTRSYSDSMKDYQLYIFDGFMPDRLPSGALFILNPPPGNKLLAVKGDIKNIVKLQTAASDEVMRYVDTQEWQIRQSRVIDYPRARTILESQGYSLLMKGEMNGQKTVIAAFDLHDSNIPLQAGFPILIQNLCQWLLPQAVSSPSLDSSGKGFDFIPPADTRQLNIINPSGEEHSYTAPIPHYFSIEEPGLYRIITTGDTGKTEYYLAKNQGDILESDIKPQSLNWPGGESKQNSHKKGMSQKDLWPWIAAGAFLLLLLEWEVYRRGY
jgi:hypothetical protein